MSEDASPSNMSVTQLHVGSSNSASSFLKKKNNNLITCQQRHKVNTVTGAMCCRKSIAKNNLISTETHDRHAALASATYLEQQSDITENYLVFQNFKIC